MKKKIKTISVFHKRFKKLFWTFLCHGVVHFRLERDIRLYDLLTWKQASFHKLLAVIDFSDLWFLNTACLQTNYLCVLYLHQSKFISWNLNFFTFIPILTKLCCKNTFSVSVKSLLQYNTSSLADSHRCWMLTQSYMFYWILSRQFKSY